MTATTRIVYIDECVDGRVIPALVRYNITVRTARGEGMVGMPDEAQLLHAAENGWLLLTTNRRDFVRLHQQFQARGVAHGGIITVPQDDQHPARFTIRCVMLIAWAFMSLAPHDHLWRWIDL